MRDGWRTEFIGWPNHRMDDRGENGDAKAGDGAFTDGNARITLTPQPAPGPLRLRVFAFNQSGDGLIVEVDGLEIRTP